MNKEPEFFSNEQFNEANRKIDTLLKYLYNEGNQTEVNLYEFIKKEKWEFANDREKTLLIDLILRCGWFEFDSVTGNISFSKAGIVQYEIYGGYTNYQKSNASIQLYEIRKKNKEGARKRRKEAFEYIVKNTVSIVAIILSLSTAAVSIISIFDKRELRSLEREIRQLRTVQDTLVQKLNSP